jgi:hypothetical protein
VLLADGTDVPISEIDIGDLVLATDPETGETGARPVTQLIVHGGTHTLVDVELGDGTTITATDGHPFWDASERAFEFAFDLDVGDELLTSTGALATVTRITVDESDVLAYNLTIDDIHTYYAGETPVLVHNSCGAADEMAAHVDAIHGALDPRVQRGLTTAILRTDGGDFAAVGPSRNMSPLQRTIARSLGVQPVMRGPAGMHLDNLFGLRARNSGRRWHCVGPSRPLALKSDAGDSSLEQVGCNQVRTTRVPSTE